MTQYTLPQLAERFRIDTVVLSTTLVSFVVLIFDHILTFGDEIKYIWGGRPTLISVLFLLNRYFTLITMVFYLVGVTSTPLTSVDGATLSSPINIHPIEVIVVLSVVSVLIAEVMLILRVSAVYHNNKVLVSLLTSLWVVHLIMMVFVAIDTSEYLPKRHISGITNIGSYTNLIFVVPAVVFDTVVGALLTFGLHRNWGLFRDSMPLIGLIIRDGILYFSVVFVTNISWILIRYSFQRRLDSHSVFRESDLTPLEIWSACITTTMIGRLTLNLREYGPPSGDEFTLTRLRFRTEVSRQPTGSEWVIKDSHTVEGRCTDMGLDGLSIESAN